jgi:anti-sigma factor RsiW
MKECLDEAMLQAYLDGELSGEPAEKTASHLTSCVTCADAAREMQAEMSLMAAALAPEFEVNVPTERLRNRIEGAIAELQPSSVRARSASAPSWLQRLTDLFAVTPQRALSYAALAVVLVAIVALGVIYLKRGEVSRGLEIANRQDPPKSIAPAPSSAPILSPVEKREQPVVAYNDPKKTLKPTPRRENKRVPELIPGEQNYLKTIAALDATIKSDTQLMRPAIQVEYEHNLAVVNQAIANTRGAAQKNPKDADTAKFMFSAYQSKVDLLTQVADARLFTPQQK